MSFKFYQSPIGMDVEFFLKKDGKIIGAEKLINSDKGIETVNGKFVKDGVQCEINPSPNRCREILGANIVTCFNEFNKIIIKNGITIDFSSKQIITKQEFDSLSNDSKRFGCNPDYNVHNNCEINIKKISGETTKKRTCGGHLHFGFENVMFKSNTVEEKCRNCEFECKITATDLNITNIFKNKLFNIHDYKDLNICIPENKDKLYQYLNKQYKIQSDTFSNGSISLSDSAKVCINPAILIPLMDLFVGIPSVLIDRDPNASSRRMMYGKAGDFRYQPHGIEYRTLSNFWLKSYTLMHLFTGLGRTAFLIASNDINNKTEYSKHLFSIISINDIKKAINNNDYVMARDIFLKIESFLLEISNGLENYFPINKNTLKGFKQFVLTGYQNYINDDIIKNWVKEHAISDGGWERFCSNMVIDTDINEKFITTIKE